MKARTLVRGADGEASVSPHDRGVLYGDGLFETVLVVDGAAPLWPRHAARLAAGCARLGLPVPDLDVLVHECRTLCEGLARAAVRITWTRGVGERGYAPPAQPQPTLIMAAAPAPIVPAKAYEQGVAVRICATRLAAPSALAGLKHTNRLEQVLARAEWNDPAIAEGLLCDADDRVISATAANLFARIDGMLATPPVERCGVAGVARAEVLARGVATVRDIGLDALVRADEVFLTSSLRGIVPVTAIDGRRLAVGETTRALQAQWRAQGWML